MTVETYSLDYTDVTPLLPSDLSGSVSATSVPLNQSKINGFISDGASYATGIIKKAGYAPDGLEDDALRMVQVYVKSYSVAQSLQIVGHSGQLYDNALQRANDALGFFANDHGSIAQTPSNRVHHNIDSDTSDSDFLFGKDHDYPF